MQSSILHNLQAREPGEGKPLFPTLSEKTTCVWMALFGHFSYLPALFCTPLWQMDEESGLL